jgi:ubiquinone/menaquinone biosynthesis C-methylase UbiE
MLTVNFNKIQAVDPKAFNNYTLLDIGCGAGRHTCEAVRFKDAFAVGADPQFANLIDTQNKLRFQESLNEVRGIWSLVAADITCLPFPDQTFDLIICAEVLEHIRSHKAAVRELVRVLKKGSCLVVSAPRFLPEAICWKLSPTYAKTPGGHVRIYKTKELIDLFVEFDVKEWHVHFAHSLHTPYWWLRCLSDRFSCLSGMVSLYHRFLVWDVMNNCRIVRWMETLLNPILGKSVVVYFKLR